MDRPVVELFSGDRPTVRSWEFDGIAGRVVNVTADCDAFEPRLRLVSPSGEVVGYAPYMPSVTELLAVSGRYRLLLMADDEAVGRCEVRAGSPAVNPRRLEIDGPAVVHERNVRLWSFEGTAGELVRITAHRASMILNLMSPAGEFVAMNDEQMVVRLPLDGRYLVRGSARRGEPERSAVAASAVPEAAQASATLRMNAPARGELDHHGSGVGVWDFEGTAGQTISIAVRGRDPVIQLISPTAEELGSASSFGYDARLEARLPVTGRYLVRVLAHNDYWTALNRTVYEIVVRPAPASPVER